MVMLGNVLASKRAASSALLVYQRQRVFLGTLGGLLGGGREGVLHGGVGYGWGYVIPPRPPERHNKHTKPFRRTIECTSGEEPDAESKRGLHESTNC